jgi:hypothetical protein
VALTRVEYEAVRSYGSHFAIDLDHENPENACVLHENARFSVIDVIARVERHEALARNPRHAWVAADANDRRFNDSNAESRRRWLPKPWSSPVMADV